MWKHYHCFKLLWLSQICPSGVYRKDKKFYKIISVLNCTLKMNDMFIEILTCCVPHVYSPMGHGLFRDKKKVCFCWPLY